MDEISLHGFIDQINGISLESMIIMMTENLKNVTDLGPFTMISSRVSLNEDKKRSPGEEKD